MDYSYWVVRFVPNPVSGEFLNIGVIAGIDGGDWAFKHLTRFTSTTRLGGTLAPTRNWIDRLNERISNQNNTRLFDERFLSLADMARLSSRSNNLVQLSNPRNVVAQSAQHAADLLFSHLITGQGVATVKPQRRTVLRNTLLKEFRSSNVENVAQIGRSVKSRIGRSSDVFDFALVPRLGGTLLAPKIVQVSQAWSFANEDIDNVSKSVNSWNFFVSRLRDEGAHAVVEGEERAISSGLPIWVITEPPTAAQIRRDARHEDAILAAREAWNLLGITEISAADSYRVSRQAQELIAA